LQTLRLLPETLWKQSPSSKRVPTLDCKTNSQLPIMLWKLKQPEQMPTIQLMLPLTQLRRSSTEQSVNWNNSRKTLIEPVSKLTEKFSLMKFSKDSMKQRVKKPTSLMLLNT
jgi:hypothetical protein